MDVVVAAVVVVVTGGGGGVGTVMLIGIDGVVVPLALIVNVEVVTSVPPTPLNTLIL